MLIFLLVITTVLLALSGIVITRLCKMQKDAATAHTTTKKILKKKSYDNYQLFLDETAAHEIALEEIVELKDTLRAFYQKIDKLNNLLVSQETEANKSIATAESNVRWMSDYIDSLRKKLRRSRLERDLARADLKYLEVTDGYDTLRAYRSENYTKIYVVGWGYLVRPLQDGFPHIDRNGNFHAVEHLIKEIRSQIKAVRAVAFRGVK